MEHWLELRQYKKNPLSKFASVFFEIYSYIIKVSVSKIAVSFSFWQYEIFLEQLETDSNLFVSVFALKLLSISIGQ